MSKLYTKEQVKEVYLEGWNDGQHDNIGYIDRVVDSLTPIELPNDEEIEVIALNMISNLKDKLESREEAFYLGGFQTCINWMKEQILNQNK